MAGECRVGEVEDRGEAGVACLEGRELFAGADRYSTTLDQGYARFTAILDLACASLGRAL